MAKRGPYLKKPKAAPPAYRKTFLAQWRLTRGWSQEELAAKAGVSTATVSGIESGTSGYSPQSLSKLARALGITPGMILDVDPRTQAPLWALIAGANEDEREQIAKHASIIVDNKRLKRK